MSDRGKQLGFDESLLRRLREEAAALAGQLLDAARKSRGNEGQFIMMCDVLLADFARRAGVRWEPQGERRVVTVEEGIRRRGRIDRLFNRVVVEFEPPGSLYATNEAATNRHGIGQARRYMDGLIEEERWKSPSIAGVVSDGFRFIFCRVSAGRWVEEAPVDTNAASVARFLRLLLTFHRPPLLPEPLIEKFGADSPVTSRTVKAFYNALGQPSHKLTPALYTQWQDFFADIAGLDAESLRDKKELVAFAGRVLARKRIDAPRLLFSLYTYSAMLIKLLAVAAVTPFLDTGDMDRLAHWAMLDSDQIRERLREVESGEFFRARKIVNFTEGDFFGWYCDEWGPALAKQVKAVLQELSEFDPDAVEQAPERVRDLLKSLYHGLLPRDVRHALGEYYTPDWLAERLLAQVDSDLFSPAPPSSEARRKLADRNRSRLETTSFIDPACGSGTFLVLVVRALRQWAREAGLPERDRLLPALLKNVTGFDLNPLAVISSRANFLLAIADLLSGEREPIELPVYLADSIVLPAEAQGTTLFEARRGVRALPLRGVRKKLLIPPVLAERDKLDRLAHLLRRDVEQEPEVGVEAFLQACEGEFAMSDGTWRDCRPYVEELYQTLRQLHREGRNGLWADIARNMFMPLFVEKADFVVGNPPWVNWQTLPQEYRERSKDLWQHYGLFVHSGMDTILGKGKKEISTLLTYVAADLYLKPRGKLGFVIDRRVFKTTGAGQGFRRFQIGSSGAHLRVLGVDDFSAFQPFEGATNQTATVVLQKGQATTYRPPVPYNVWRKAGRASVPFDATLEEALALLRQTHAAAEPVDADDPTSSWLTAPRRVLPTIRKVLGPSYYRAYAGAYSGGANAVFWLRVLRTNADGTVDVENITERQRRAIKAGRHTVEASLLYPLLRGRDVGKWVAMPNPDVKFLIVQEPKTRQGLPEAGLVSECPRTFAYLVKHREVLLRRKAFARYFREGDPFYSMFNVGEYTFARCKVVWAEQGSFGCAVVEQLDDKPVVPDHKVMLIPCDDPDEAHFVCAVANSSPFRLAVRSYAISIQQDPHVFATVRVPEYDATSAKHRRLADLSRQAHRIAGGDLSGVLSDVERQVDESACTVWGLSPDELGSVYGALAEMG